ncbi:MAG: DUF5667 domain-containing protein [Desulfitobacteriaceae bacterium]
MKKIISLMLSGAIILIPMVSAVPALADTGLSTGTNVSDTVYGTVYGTKGETNPTYTTVVDSKGQTVTAGILPDSPLYWFTNLIDKLQLALTFDPAKEANLIEHQALEKLAEASELVKKGKHAEAQQAIENYTSKITAAQDFLTQVKDPTSAKAQILIEALNKIQASNISVLTGLLDKLPPQAAQKVALNVVRNLEKAVEKQSSVTVTDKVYNPSQVKSDKDKDKNDDRDKAKNKNKNKNKNEIKIALETLRHDLEQKGTTGNMTKLQTVANSVYSIHPQSNHSYNQEQKEVTSPKDLGTMPNNEKQRGQERGKNMQKGKGN